MSEPDRLEAVILDMDGVVTDTAGVHARAWTRLFDEFLRARSARDGTPFIPFDPVRDYLDFVDGKPRYAGARSFLESRGIDLPEGGVDDGPDAPTVRGLGNRKDAYFDELLRTDGVARFEDTVRRLGELRAAGARTALVTSSKHGAEIVELTGLGDLFDVRLDGNDIEALGLRGKPDPDLFVEAARRLGVAPARAAVVEDAVSGVEAGRAGGFGLVIGVNRGANREALERGGADRVVDDLGALSADEILTPARAEIPSALERLPELAARLAAGRAAVFLDYDGTLTPIVARPELAVLAPASREALRRLAEVATVAVVSGRALASVRELVGLPDLVYAGNHGFEIAGPDGTALEREVGREFIEEVAAARAALEPVVGAIPGAWVEDKTHSLSVHYRQTPDERAGEVEAAVDAALAGRPRLRKHYGKKVLEVRPRIEWDKGRAVLWLLEALGLDGPGVVPVYVGDDVTDEDAFRALPAGGVGVLVSEVPRPTAAGYRVDDPAGVRDLLLGLAGRLPGGGR
ncbi:MAG: trehalose-phosphatase [Thermoleophilia bacterium]|nr:trehalose-phosphatase [Thermoleophilia bacterium]